MSTQYPLSIKIGAFFALTTVQVGVALVYKASQTRSGGQYSFHPSSALTISEFIKFWLSFYFYLTTTPTTTSSSLTSSSLTSLSLTTYHSNNNNNNSILKSLVSQLSKQLILTDLGLATLYCINNHLSFLLFLWADSASITLIKSSSSFISAFILFVVLGRSINHFQWCAICLQVFGLVVVQYDSCRSTTLLPPFVYGILFCAVAITSITSVWNENILKTNSASLHVQNMVLYAFGTGLNFMAFLCTHLVVESNITTAATTNSNSNSNSSWANVGFFEGYTLGAVGVVFANSIIGIVVTAVYKYADAIIKTFGSATATCILLFINFAFFNNTPTLVALMGCGVVFIASYIYFVAGTLLPPPTQTSTLPLSSTTSPSTLSMAATSSSSSSLFSSSFLKSILFSRNSSISYILHNLVSRRKGLCLLTLMLSCIVLLLLNWSKNSTPTQSHDFIFNERVNRTV